MERDLNYILIGLFVILLCILLIISILWLSSIKYKQEYKYYKIRFKESVSGLSIGSPVKYKGIKIGSVDKLYIDKDDPNIINVIVKIEKDVPIKVDARASLAYQGITGLAHIEIKGGSRTSKDLESIDNGKYPEIKTEPSIITRLDTTLTILSNQAQHLVSNLNYLLSKNNINKLMETIDNINKIIKTIANRDEDISKTIISIKYASSNLPKLILSTNENIEKISNNINKILYKVNIDEENLNNLIKSKINLLSSSSNDSIKELKLSLVQLQNVLKKLDSFIESIEDRPSKLLLDNMLVKPGPGE